MSEKAGATSIDRWQQFERAFLKHADNQDWEKVGKINELMITELKKQGKPKTRSQYQARQSLMHTHEGVLQRLIQAKDKLGQEMSQFKQQQHGLAAYELTSLSSAGSINGEGRDR